MSENVSAPAVVLQAYDPVHGQEITAIEPDRNAIRKNRATAAKQSKRLVRERFEDILRARPEGSRPADQVLERAVSLYAEGPIPRQKLKTAISRLEVLLRQDISDLVVLRAPKTVSAKPEKVGLMVYETRAVTAENQQFISALNHSIVLAEDRVYFISGGLPGGTRPHLFERVFERNGGRRTLADIQLHLSTLWPTLLWMRAEQRRFGRGTPFQVMMTPFEDGLLFGDLQKVTVPPAGPTAAVVYAGGQQTRILRDYYGDPDGNRLWAMTNTFVDGALLSPEQKVLRDILHSYTSEYADIVADHNWRWRIGLGEDDPAVAAISETFRLTIPSPDRRSAALADLEAIAASDPWQIVAARSLQSLQDRQRRYQT